MSDRRDAGAEKAPATLVPRRVAGSDCIRSLIARYVNIETETTLMKTGMIELILVGKRETRWRLEIKDLSVLRSRLGEEVLRAFVRCFVHADRLTSLAHFGPMGLAARTKEVASRRNYLTAVWFAIGTLREFSRSLRSLRNALAKRHMLGFDLGPMDRLREVENRWENDPFLRSLRNTHAFHVDDDAIALGLERLYRRTRPVTVSEGEGKSDYEASTTIGSDALFLGIGVDEVELGRLLRIVHDDFKVYLALDEVFLAVLRRVGVRLKQKAWSEARRPKLTAMIGRRG